MADKQFSSADKNISIQAAAPKAKVNPKAILGTMTKDVKQRWMIVGGVTAATIVVLVAAMSKSPVKPVLNQKTASVVETSPKGLSANQDWRTQTGAELLELKKALAQSQATQQEMLARMESMRQELGQVKSNPAPAPQPGFPLTLPPPPVPPATLTPPSSVVKPTSPAAGVAPTAPVAQPEAIKRSPARAFIPTSAETSAAEQKTDAIEEMVSNERKGFLPAGSFAASTLISGVEAFTGGTAQSQPQPVVLRVDANAVLPNAANYQVKGCHVLASVWGDMSSERVFGRLATLTCVDSANRLVLSDEVEGVLVDSDGKNGIRGQLQDRQGAKLARSLLAGFAQGMSAAFGSAQTTTLQTAAGMSTALTGSSVEAAGYAGAGKAAEQLAQFYLKQAEATMPVIAVDAGRKLSILFTKSKALKFETTDAYRVKPKTTLMVERPSR